MERPVSLHLCCRKATDVGFPHAWWQPEHHAPGARFQPKRVTLRIFLLRCVEHVQYRNRPVCMTFALTHVDSAIFIEKKTLSGAALHQRKALILARFKCVVSTHFGNCVLLTLSLLLWFYRQISNV
jgi:hypothetical protein